IYTTGQIAKRLKVHKNTILYWLRTKKIKEPKRDKIFDGRIWTEKDVIKLTAIKKRKGEGLSGIQ
ncbi:MAG: MerR family transcriptional regulator, partial [Candidatus Omnitrophica bacterium]|nr:MerR family transcriptional regulator [Candidatus Omnitrophota bacterium]